MPTSLRRPLPGTGRPRLLALLAGAIVLASALAVVPATRAWAETTSNYVPLSVASRLAHTPDGTGGFTGPRGAGSTTIYQVLGRAGVPATGVTAVMLDVAAVSPPNGTTLTLWPDGQPRPDTSMVNGVAGKTISNSAAVPVGSNGKISVYSTGVSNLTIDIQGYFTPGTGGNGFQSVQHTRLVDSRYGTGVAQAKIPNGGTVSFVAAGTGTPIPGGVPAVYANIAVPTPSNGGWLAVYPTGSTQSASTVDYIQGSTTSSGAAIRVGTGGRITIRNQGPAVDVVVDVEGYFSTAAGTGSFRAATARIFDSRVNGSGAKVGANATIQVAVGGTAGLPLRNLTGAALSVTAVATTVSSSLRVWPTGDPEPGTAIAHNSSVSYGRANMVVVRPGRDGKVTIRNLGSAGQHVVVDLQGWFAPVGAPLDVEQYSRSAGLQATTGFLELAYVNNVGQLVVGRIENKDVLKPSTWTTISGGEGFTGQPALGLHANGRLQVAAQNIDRDIWARSRASESAPDFTLPWLDLGGSMAAPPAVGRTPDARLVLFGVDVDGQLWHLPQTTADGNYAVGWANLGDADLVGTPTVAPVSDGLRLAALATGGQVKVAAYQAGALSAWTSLGGSGFTGTPALVVLPGGRLRVVVRGADGTVMTKQQTTTGTWPSAWDPVSGLTAAGSPAAILSPRSSRIELVARTADGTLWSTGETAQGSGTWRPWVTMPNPDGPAMTDPIVFPFTSANPNVGQTWTAAVRDVNQQSTLIADEGVSGAAAAAAAEGEADRDRSPRFVRWTLSPPPR
jgi:hypothetical protein